MLIPNLNYTDSNGFKSLSRGKDANSQLAMCDRAVCGKAYQEGRMLIPNFKHIMRHRNKSLSRGKDANSQQSLSAPISCQKLIKREGC